VQHLRRPSVRLVFAVSACALMLLNVPFAAGFALWLAFGPPPPQPVIVPASAGVFTARPTAREHIASAMSDVVA
ncbi:MAG: hypothetical protein ACXVP3_09695, partial [Actinomycetota bacterium]